MRQLLYQKVIKPKRKWLLVTAETNGFAVWLKEGVSEDLTLVKYFYVDTNKFSLEEVFTRNEVIEWAVLHGQKLINNEAVSSEATVFKPASVQ